MRDRCFIGSLVVCMANRKGYDCSRVQIAQKFDSLIPHSLSLISEPMTSCKHTFIQRIQNHKLTYTLVAAAIISVYHFLSIQKGEQ